MSKQVKLSCRIVNLEVIDCYCLTTLELLITYWISIDITFIFSSLLYRIWKKSYTSCIKETWWCYLSSLIIKVIDSIFIFIPNCVEFYSFAIFSKFRYFSIWSIYYMFTFFACIPTYKLITKSLISIICKIKLFCVSLIFTWHWSATISILTYILYVVSSFWPSCIDYLICLEIYYCLCKWCCLIFIKPSNMSISFKNWCWISYSTSTCKSNF